MQGSNTKGNLIECLLSHAFCLVPWILTSIYNGRAPLYFGGGGGGGEKKFSEKKILPLNSSEKKSPQGLHIIPKGHYPESNVIPKISFIYLFIYFIYLFVCLFVFHFYLKNELVLLLWLWIRFI